MIYRDRMGAVLAENDVVLFALAPGTMVEGVVAKVDSGLVSAPGAAPPAPRLYLTVTLQLNPEANGVVGGVVKIGSMEKPVGDIAKMATST